MTAKETMQNLGAKFNAQDLEGFIANYAEDAVVYDPFHPQPLKGKQAIRQDMAEFFKAFPDCHDEQRSLLVGDGTCAVEFLIEATHRGPLAGPDGEISPTGKRVEFGVGTFCRVNDRGKVVEEHRYYDVLAMLKQLGVES